MTSNLERRVYLHRVDSRTVGSHENKQQGHGPDEERKDRPLAGHVVRGLDRSDEERAPQLSI